MHSGPVSVLKDIERELIAFVDEWRRKGLPVNRFILMQKACSLKPELQLKSESAAKMSISRFMKKNRFTHRMATHKAQRHPSEVEADALQFLDVMRPILLEQNRDLDYVINMDQTPVYHVMDFKTTIDKVCVRTVNLRTSAADSKRVTVAVTVTASGKQLKSMVVFKGKSLAGVNIKNKNTHTCPIIVAARQSNGAYRDSRAPNSMQFASLCLPT